MWILYATCPMKIYYCLPTDINLVTTHGRKYLVRTSNHPNVEGEEKIAGLILILQWPSKEVALAFIYDHEYIPHLNEGTDRSVNYYYLTEAKDKFAKAKIKQWKPFYRKAFFPSIGVDWMPYFC